MNSDGEFIITDWAHQSLRRIHLLVYGGYFWLNEQYIRGSAEAIADIWSEVVDSLGGNNVCVRLTPLLSLVHCKPPKHTQSSLYMITLPIKLIAITLHKSLGDITQCVKFMLMEFFQCYLGRLWRRWSLQRYYPFSYPPKWSLQTATAKK